MIENMQDFHSWEKASRDTIDFKKIYCDIAGESNYPLDRRR